MVREPAGESTWRDSMFNANTPQKPTGLKRQNDFWCPKEDSNLHDR